MDRWHNIKMILTLRCRESSRLLSDNLERPLTRSEQIALRMHLLVCQSCRRFSRQIHFLRDLTHRLHHQPNPPEDPRPTLTAAERQRIHDAAHRARRQRP